MNLLDWVFVALVVMATVAGFFAGPSETLSEQVWRLSQRAHVLNKRYGVPLGSMMTETPEEEADRLLLEADPEFAAELGIVPQQPPARKRGQVTFYDDVLPQRVPSHHGRGPKPV